MNSTGAADTQKIRQLVTGYQVARALLAADELDLVEKLKDGPNTASELAAETDTDGSALFRFLRALCAIDLFKETPDGRFALGSLAPGLRDAARIGVENYAAWVELPFSLRTGRAAFPKVHGKTFYGYLAEEERRAARFDNALAAVSLDWAPAVLDAYDFTGIDAVADIGGGRGTFLTILLRAYPKMHGILFDQPDVVRHSKPILQSAGVLARCDAIGGSFFEEVPAGADAYTLCNLLADWPDKDAVQILKSVERALPTDGKVLIIDRVLPPAGDPGRQAMAFLDLFFLVMEGGAIRTEQEFADLLAHSGLRHISTIATNSTFSIIEAQRP